MTTISKPTTAPSSLPRKMHTLNNHKLALIVSALGAFATTGQAAVVSFGTGTAIVDETDVSTNGTLLSATTFDIVGNGASDTTVNGVLFKAGTYGGFLDPLSNVNGSNVTADYEGGIAENLAAFPSTGDTDYNELLAHLSYLHESYGAQQMNLTNLTVGHTYEFQIWSGQGTGGGAWNDRDTTFTAGANSVTLNSGEFVIGSFTADATTQAMTWEGVSTANGGSDYGIINGIQIRTTAVPEPSSTALLGLGGLALILRRRK